MKYTKDQVFRAFKWIHNQNDEGDIYLPCDQPEELFQEEAVDIETGCWVKNCNVWITTEEIQTALSQLSDENFY